MFCQVRLFSFSEAFKPSNYSFLPPSEVILKKECLWFGEIGQIGQSYVRACARPYEKSSMATNDPKHMTPSEYQDTEEKKQAFIEALVEAGGIRQIACERASQKLGKKVSRSSVYYWLKNDGEFARKVAEANQIGDAITVDLAQSTLIQRTQGMYYKEQVAFKIKIDQYKEKVEVKEVQRYLPPDYHAAKILLAAKAAHLGYGNHQTIQHSGEVMTKNIQVIIANPYEEEADGEPEQDDGGVVYALDAGKDHTKKREGGEASDE